MASEIFALLRCVRTADRHADGALIGFTEEDEAREELGHPWVKRRRFLVAVLLLTMTFFVSLAYSLVGSFFPIEVNTDLPVIVGFTSAHALGVLKQP